MKYISTKDSVTVLLDGTPKTVSREVLGENSWRALHDHLATNNEFIVKRILNTAQRVINWSAGNLQVKDGVMYYKDYSLEGNYAAEKALELMRSNLPFKPLLGFIENLMLNPSYRSVEQLYGFLEHNHMPLTETGCFVAYKKVRSDFKDIHSGRMDNSPGKTVSMLRNQVDEDPERTCSRGLHVCGYEYLLAYGSGHGDKVVAVEVNPKDVVAVPHDYNNAKMRVASYRVLAQIHDYATVDSLTKQKLWGYESEEDLYLDPDEGDDDEFPWI